MLVWRAAKTQVIDRDVVKIPVQAGDLIVADGHHRIARLHKVGDLDQRVNIRVLEEADGITADDARVYGLVNNAVRGNIDDVEAAMAIKAVPDVLDFVSNMKNRKVVRGLIHLENKLLERLHAREQIVKFGGSKDSLTYLSAPPKNHSGIIGNLLNLDALGKHFLDQGKTEAETQKILKVLREKVFERWSKEKLRPIEGIAGEQIKGLVEGQLRRGSQGLFEGFDLDWETDIAIRSVYLKARDKLERVKNVYRTGEQEAELLSKAKGTNIDDPNEQRKLKEINQWRLEFLRRAFDENMGVGNPYYKDVRSMVVKINELEEDLSQLKRKHKSINRPSKSRKKKMELEVKELDKEIENQKKTASDKLIGLVDERAPRKGEIESLLEEQGILTPDQKEEKLRREAEAERMKNQIGFDGLSSVRRRVRRGTMLANQSFANQMRRFAA